MDKSIQHVIDQAQGVVDGTTAVLFFRLANITVEADPLSLLSTTVKVGDTERTIEEVASCSLLDKYSFAFVPKDNEYILPLIKGLMTEHPDFRIEQKESESSAKIKFTDEERKMLGLTDDDSGEQDNTRYLVCKMPEMDDDRRDNYIDLTTATCDVSKRQIEAQKVKFEAVMLKRTLGMPSDQVEEAKAELEGVFEGGVKDCESSQETKIKSIEEAYQQYLSSLDDSSAATSGVGSNVSGGGADSDSEGDGFQMSMNE